MIILITGLAGSAIAREIENGTIEHLLAKPIERWKIYISKYIGGSAVISIFTVVSVFSIIPAAAIFGIDYNIWAQFAVFVLSLLFALMVYSLAMMFSALFSEKGKVSLAMSVIMIVMYVLNIVAVVVERVEWFKHASFFHYFDYDAALKENMIDTTNLLVFAGVILVTTTIGILWFERRDVTV
jgi:ABC-2 type transport system permease protein